MIDVQSKIYDKNKIYTKDNFISFFYGKIHQDYPRYAFSYNPNSNDFIDNDDTQQMHELSSQQYEDGWCRGYFCLYKLFKGKLICYISGDLKENVFKTYEMVLSEFSNFMCDYYILEWGYEDDYQTLVLNSNGKIEKNIIAETFNSCLTDFLINKEINLLTEDI